MNESLFWKDGFPEKERVELVAELLYSGDSDALRERLNKGLLPDRVKDFYAAALGFTSLEDLDARLEEVQTKYQLPVQTPFAPRALPSADPFTKFFPAEEPKAKVVRRKVQSEIPVPAAPEVKISRPRVRKTRMAAPEQPIVPVPSFRIAPPVEAPAVEAVPVPPTPDVHPEDRVSAFARGILAWFGRKPQAAEYSEGIAEGAGGAARTREVVSELLAKEFGAEVFETGVSRDPKSRAHVEAANRLARAIATSAHLEPARRASMKEHVESLRTAYEGRMEEMARARSGELQADLDAVTVREQGDANAALRVLASRAGRIADDVMRFREHVEHAAVQRGGVEAVAAVDEAFQDAWREAWKGPVTPMNIGPLEESLPRLRLLGGNAHSGVARLVTQARASIQEEIDRRLPTVERQMKRAA